MSGLAHRWHVFADADAMADGLCSHLHMQLQACFERQDTALLGLAGGSTPMAAYAQFTAGTLPWQRLHCVLIDERFVPLHDERSNEANIAKAFAPVRAQLAGWHGLMQASDDIATAAALADADVHALARPMDVLVLGMGSDGHLASLFAESRDYAAAMDPSTALAVVPVRFDTDTAVDRLSFTLNELLKARQACLCITGAEKRKVLNACLNGSGEHFAMARFLQQYPNPIDIFWSPA